MLSVTSLKTLFVATCNSLVCRKSVVGIATRYGLEVRGSNPEGGEIFRTHSDRPWRPPSLLYNGYRVSYGVKAAGAWR